MKTELIKFNKMAHDNELHYANIDLKAYNKLLTEINPLAKVLEVTIDKTFLAALLKNPKEFAFDTIVGEAPLTMAGMQVSKNKAMDFVEFPDAWIKIIELVAAFNKEYNKPTANTASYERSTQPARLGFERFDFVNDALVLNADLVSEIKNKHSIFTKTEAENKALELANTIGKCFNQLEKMGLPLYHTHELSSVGFGNVGLNGAYKFGFDPSVIVSKITAS